MDPIAKRTISGLAVGLGIIALFLYCPLRGILPIVFVLSLLAQLEFYQMARKYEPVTWFGLLAGSCFVLAAGLYGFSPDLFGLVPYFIPALLLTFFLLSIFVLFNSRYANPLGSIAVTLLGFFYAGRKLALLLLQLIDLLLFDGEAGDHRDDQREDHDDCHDQRENGYCFFTIHNVLLFREAFPQ